ncbi:uncharacterized protein BYT42DRAFT_376720 [Radiomyces spectabilis]|uniref:uncharacterized protein n=1 Tax=Radiomyces spectabilis TaxID=64574 RepID=UPI0022206C0B|nr:uncharacterized protein BYT42DRAFT_376720 [Radiomyces spectabilis]KAI8376156.1 hypothetical protein BYT42DRAFT_376720 [Radiomyces spectabilis]
MLSSSVQNVEALGRFRANIEVRWFTQCQQYRYLLYAVIRFITTKYSLPKAINLARQEFGLSSSRIHNAVVPKASKFIFGLTKMELMVFILFWFAGDGHSRPCYIYTKEIGSLLSYSSMEIASRDEEILKLLKAALERYDFTRLSICHYRTWMPKLKILRTPEMDQAILEALNALSSEHLHPKHKYIKAVLESPFRGVAIRFGRPRELSFIEYAPNTSNRLQCFIAQ